MHGYCSSGRECMSTALEGAREGCHSVCVGVCVCVRMCVPLSVRSSRRQQGAPFQFTHQPQMQGVKARSIAVGDFTFEGQDYQSGDPCVEVMREGHRGRGGTGAKRGGSRGGRTKGGEEGWRRGRARAAGSRAPPRNPRASVFLGELSCQAAHLFDTRRCGSPVRGRLSSFISSLSALL